MANRSQMSPKVSEILAFSKEEAMRLASTAVGPEHMMLGILREKNSPVKDFLTIMDIDMDNMKEDKGEQPRDNSHINRTIPQRAGKQHSETRRARGKGAAHADC